MVTAVDISERAKTVRALESRLREATKNARNFYDQPVRALRAQLREAYEALLLNEYNSGQARDVETALWKWVFYKPIEEFRHRVRFAADAGEKGREPLRKVKIALLKFLQEATQFYKQLAVKLQATFGDVGFTVDAQSQISSENVQRQQQQQQRTAASAVDARISVYRCLICLGDLARYEANVESSDGPKDWSSADRYYRHAALVYPAGGNAHNQLAVLATYLADDRSAVYHYFRSLAVTEPFLIARENLLLLFEQNRKRFDTLSGRQRGRDRAQPRKSAAGASDQLSELYTRFIRMHGILFTKISLDTFGGVYDDAMANLREVLARPPALKQLTRWGPAGAECPLLQLAAMAVFSAHVASAGVPGTTLRCSEALQAAEVRQHAVEMVLGLTAALAEHVLAGGSPADMQRRVLPAVHVLLLWLALQPDLLGSSGLEGRAYAAAEQFWRVAGRGVAWAMAEVQQMQLGASPAALLNKPLRVLPEDEILKGFAPFAEAYQGLAPPRLNQAQPTQERDEDATRLVTVLSSLLRIGRAVEVSLRRGHSDDAAAAGPLSAARTAFVHACSAAHQSAAGGISGQEAGQAELPGPAGVGPPGEAGHYSDARQEAQRAAEVHSASVDGDEDEEMIVYAPDARGQLPVPSWTAPSVARHAAAATDLAPPLPPELPLPAAAAIPAGGPSGCASEDVHLESNPDSRMPTVPPVSVPLQAPGYQANAQNLFPGVGGDMLECKDASLISAAVQHQPLVPVSSGLFGWDLFEGHRKSSMGFAATGSQAPTGAATAGDLQAPVLGYSEPAYALDSPAEYHNFDQHYNGGGLYAGAQPDARSASPGQPSAGAGQAEALAAQPNDWGWLDAFENS